MSTKFDIFASVTNSVVGVLFKGLFEQQQFIRFNVLNKFVGTAQDITFISMPEESC